MEHFKMQNTIDLIHANLRAGLPASAGIAPLDWEKALKHYSDFIDTFDHDNFLTESEVVVSNFNTPRPSLHLMASNHDNEYGIWGSFWDQFGGGFSCLDSVIAGKMSSHLDTNYVPTAPEPQDARLFFIHENNSAWPMLPSASFDAGEYSQTRCYHGLDVHRIEAEKNGIAAQLQIMVHPSHPLEVMRLRLTNNSERVRTFSWFIKLRVNIDSFPFYYFVPRVVCEGIIEDNAMIFLNHDRGNKHQRQAFFAASPDFDGFDMMAESFDGIGGRNAIPEAVRRGQCRNSPGLQPYAGMVAATQYNTTLAPNETKSWTMAYGVCPYDSNARRKYITEIKTSVLDNYEQIAMQIQHGWRNKIERFKIKTPEVELDRYFNVWSRYQARNQARFVRALDKIGYRDILQDLLGVCDISPAYVRTMLLRTLSYQLPDGRAIRQYEKFTGAGHDLRMYMDSSSWIPALLVQHLQETGDLSLLEERVPYYNETTGQPDTAQAGTVYEHALKAVESLAGFTGYHGLCKIGYGDWNDALSGIGGENGVSVWLSCACVYAADKMSQISARAGHAADAERMRKIADKMTFLINEHAWHGDWYIYAINGKGEPIGSKSNEEGKIHLNSNTWALFTGVAAAAGREASVLQAIANLDTPCGHRLLWPSYRNTDRSSVGRIVDMKPGMFENGSIYTHGEAFFLYALIRAGHADECCSRLLAALPSAQIQEITTGPRHQQSNFTVGPDHENFGMQLFSNFTGSLSWFRRVIEEMLGVYPDFDALIIKPMPPAAWQGYEVSRIWRNRKIRVICQPAKNEKTSINLNGMEYTDERIPLQILSLDQENIIKVRY